MSENPLTELIARQFDNEQGGGFADPDTYRTDADRQPFGDGSNQWVPGYLETVRNPVDRLTNPGETIAGAYDALALNFDEGVGGLVSLRDDDPGNTAGPGQNPVIGDRDGPLSRVRLLLFGAVAVGVLWLLRPLLSILADVIGFTFGEE